MTYTLNDDNQLRIDYEATTTESTGPRDSGLERACSRFNPAVQTAVLEAVVPVRTVVVGPDGRLVHARHERGATQSLVTVPRQSSM